MLNSDEPNVTDVNELLNSWISASPPSLLHPLPLSEAFEGTINSSHPAVPPRVSGLLQGTLLQDFDPSLNTVATPGVRYIQRTGSSATDVRPGDQTTVPDLEPDVELFAKRSKRTGQGGSEPTPRNSEVNRRAQKKFRQKQKERFEELQTRLRDTASELKKKDDMIAQLRTAQQQLHRRNVVLESLYKTGSMLLPTSGALSTSAPVFASLPSSASPAIKPVSSPTEPLQSVSAPFNTRTPPLAVAAVPGGAAPWPETLGTLNRQYVAQDIGDSGYITLALLGGACQMSMTELSTMQVPDFAKLWTAYIKNLAPALTAPRRDPSARGFTKQMAKELGHLIECVKLVNMDCFHALIEGKVNPALARTVNMDEAFYNKLQKILRLSDEQEEDITYLRKLYFTRRAVLAEQRRKLEHEVADAKGALRSVPLPNDSLSKMSALSAQLQHVAEEDCRVYFRILTAIRRKVLTPEQFALICIHAYPYIISGEQWLCVWKSEFSHESKDMIVAAAAIFDMKAEWEDLEALLADTSSEGPVRLLNHIGNAATKAGKAGSAAMTAAAASNGGFRTASEAGGLPALLSTTPAGSSMYSAAEQEHRARPTFDALVLPAATPFATGQSSPSPFAVSQMGTSARQSSWAAGILDPLLAVSHPPNAGQSSWSPALTDPSLSNSRSSHKDFGRWPTAHLGTDVPSGMFDPWQQSWAIGSLQGAATASGDLFGSENQQQRSSAVHSNDPLVSSGHAGAQHNWASASAPAAPSLDDLLSNSLLGVHQTNWALPPSTFSTAQGSKDMGWRGHSQNTTVSSGMLQSSLQPTQDAMLVARARLQGQPLFSEDATRDARAVEVPREASDAHLMGEASSFRSSPQPDAKTSHPHHLSLY